MIEWYPNKLSAEKKLKIISNIPEKMIERAKHLERIYGHSYITLNKDGSYSLYYYDSHKKEIIEVK